MVEKNRIYLVTKVIQHRINIFSLDVRYPMMVIENLKFYRKKFGFKLYGYVIMPDHYHLVVNTLDKVTVEKFKEDMNKFIARQMVADLKDNRVTHLLGNEIATLFNRQFKPIKIAQNLKIRV